MCGGATVLVAKALIILLAKGLAVLHPPRHPTRVAPAPEPGPSLTRYGPKSRTPGRARGDDGAGLGGVCAVSTPWDARRGRDFWFARRSRRGEGARRTGPLSRSPVYGPVWRGEALRELWRQISSRNFAPSRPSREIVLGADHPPSRGPAIPAAARESWTPGQARGDDGGCSVCGGATVLVARALIIGLAQGLAVLHPPRHPTRVTPAPEPGPGLTRYGPNSWTPGRARGDGIGGKGR